MADAASLWPDLASSATDDAPPAAEPAQAQDSGRADAPTPTREEADRTTSEKPEKVTPAAPPKEAAPAAITLTQAELDAQIAEATKRARSDQSALARQVTELQRRLEGRESAYAALMERFQEYPEVRHATLEEWYRGENYAASAAAEDAKAAEDAQRAADALSGRKTDEANRLCDRALAPLIYEAGTLGVSEVELHALKNAFLKTDPTAQRIFAKWRDASTVEEARDYAELVYDLMAKELRPRLQQQKIDTLKEPEATNPRPDRTQAHGTGGNVAVDPLGQLPMGKRAQERTRGGLLEDARRLYQLEQ